MLGTPRAKVTEAAGALRDARLIDYSGGVIEVRDREGLEARSCPCYRVIRDELDRLLSEPRAGDEDSVGERNEDGTGTGDGN